MAKKNETPATIVNSQSEPIVPVATPAKPQSVYELDVTVGEKTITLNFGKSSKVAKAVREQANKQGATTALKLTKIIP